MASGFHPTLKRWLWFVGLWVCGVATVGVISLILRAWIGHAVN